MPFTAQIIRYTAWAVAKVIAALPLAAIEHLAVFMVTLALPLMRKEKRNLYRNVQAIYGLPPHSTFAKQFCRQVFVAQLLTNFESIKEIMRPGSLRIDPSPELQDAVKRAEAAGAGHMLITAHLGSWELCGQEGLRVSTRKLYPLAKPPKVPGMQDFLNDLRSKMKVEVLWTDRRSLFKDMLRAVKQGHAIGFVMDQKPGNKEASPVVPFMGRPTPFVAGPASLTELTGAAVISIFVVRVGRGHYRVIGREIYSAHHGVKDEQLLTATMAAEIERVVRLYPEQWAWNYRRWRFDTAAV